MSRRTQGTMLWFVAMSLTDPTKYELVKVGCPLNFKSGTDSRGRIENTCLEQEDYKTYHDGGGLADTGQSTFDINADPQIASHVRLYDMSTSNETATWIQGWAGKTKGSVKNIVPVVDVDTGEVTLPPGRSWNRFSGYIESFPMDFDADSVVKTALTIQRSTPVEWIPEATIP